MKNCLFVLILLILSLSFSYADNGNNDSRFRIKDRSFEFGLKLDGGFSNNVVSISDFQKEKLILDFTNQPDGINFDFGSGITPFYFMFNYKNNWGFGLSLNIESFGHIGLSENLIRFNETNNDKSDSGFFLFTDAALDVFFHIYNVKFKLKPAVFYTAAYAKPEIIYSYDTTGTPSLIIDYDIRIYTPFRINDIEDFDIDTDSFNAVPGIDFSFGIEYPLSKALGINKRFYLFDFDVGIGFFHIPVTPSISGYYLQYSGNLKMEGENIDEFFSSMDEDEFFNDPVSGEEEKSIRRPFRTALYVNWRPMESRVFTITPQAGFSVNPLYIEPFSMEYGLKAKMDLANIFILFAGVNFEDRLWKSGINFIFNLRAIELNAGIDARSYKFKNIFNPSGFGISAGLKFGW